MRQCRGISALTCLVNDTTHSSMTKQVAYCPKLFGKSHIVKSPLVTVVCPKFNPKSALSPSMITTTSSTRIPRLTALTIADGIWIHSAVFPQHTLWTDRQTVQANDPSHKSLTLAKLRIQALKLFVCLWKTICLSLRELLYAVKIPQKLKAKDQKLKTAGKCWVCIVFHLVTSGVQKASVLHRLANVEISLW